MKRTTFSRWLNQQTNRQDPVGDLARDARDDSGTMGLDSLEAWIRHLTSVQVNAGDGAIHACGRAWAEFYRDKGD